LVGVHRTTFPPNRSEPEHTVPTKNRVHRGNHIICVDARVIVMQLPRSLVLLIMASQLMRRRGNNNVVVSSFSTTPRSSPAGNNIRSRRLRRAFQHHGQLITDGRGSVHPTFLSVGTPTKSSYPTILSTSSAFYSHHINLIHRPQRRLLSALPMTMMDNYTPWGAAATIITEEEEEDTNALLLDFEDLEYSNYRDLQYSSSSSNSKESNAVVDDMSRQRLESSLTNTLSSLSVGESNRQLEEDDDNDDDDDDDDDDDVVRIGDN
jgi:hypothetical protein